jgi:predicted O-linked N-acetylglucosamine transferase (SPINDLY family)
MSAVPETLPTRSGSLIEQAAELHGRGRLDEAALIYREILARDPQDFDATQLLGVLALQQGRLEDAQRLIGAAISISPHDVASLGNLGVSYLSAGHFASAYEWFAVALILQPDSPSALLNVGIALQRLGRHGEALPILTRAYDRDPASYELALRLGFSQLATGDPHAAIDAFESATLSDPRAAEAWQQLAAARAAVGEHAQAQACLDHAATLSPDADALLLTAGDSAAFADSGFRRPAASLLSQTAYVLLANGLSEPAVERLRRVLELEPDNLTARWVMALAPLKSIDDRAEDIIPSRDSFARSIAEIAAWYRENPDRVKEPYKALSVVQPFCLAYQPFNNRALLTRYGEICVAWMATLPIGSEPVAGTATRARYPAAGARIRLGIASPHIKEHSVWNALTKGWVHHLDRGKFEIHLFQLNSDGDVQTQEARAAVDSFENRPTSVEDWARVIQQSDLDVLIYPSVGMDPLTQQLAALRLAPMQATTWGHPETTGFATMDLYLSAEFLEPENAADNYSERLVRLPNLGVYVEPLAPPDVPLDLAALGLPADEPLLLCPGTPFKYSPYFDDVWVKIAHALRKRLFGPGRGRLVFFRSRVAAMDRALEARLRAAFARAGTDFDAHVSIIPTLDRARYYALMRRSALLLDTLGFSGFNTAIQALECGLPVLAYEGEFMRGRLASGLLRRLDLPELVATTPRQFIDMAVELARDAGKRRRLRTVIAQRREILFHDLSAIRALEDCLVRELANARSAAP